MILVTVVGLEVVREYAVVLKETDCALDSDGKFEMPASIEECRVERLVLTCSQLLKPFKNRPLYTSFLGSNEEDGNLQGNAQAASPVPEKRRKHNTCVACDAPSEAEVQ